MGRMNADYSVVQTVLERRDWISGEVGPHAVAGGIQLIIIGDSSVIAELSRS
jgi:hypothetical protein